MLAAATKNPPVLFYVPTIDISPYLNDPSSRAAENVIDEVRKASVSTGFFQIVGHGVSRALQDSVFEAAARFFALPFDEKKKIDAKANVGMRGYDVLASQSYEEGVLPDLKEGFYVGENLPADDPRVKARRFFMGSNVWPSNTLLPESEFRVPIEAYFTAVYDLSLVVLQLIARTLPYGPRVFDQFVSNNPATPLRLLHYPPAQKTEERQLGASAHTDFGAITLLLQDSSPGLEVLDRYNDKWVPVAPNTDAYVVNIGDMLSKWTKNEYKSSLHRVVNKNPWDRYSVVFFFDGNLDCPLAPLDGSAVDEKVTTVDDYMVGCMKASYGK